MVRFVIPNFISLASVFFALFAIKSSLNGLFSNAISFIFISVILDYFDGFFARKLNATSKFGAQMDSLCDSFSFGVAPAMCLYFWMFVEFKTFGWILCFLMIAAMILRLARFNAFDILGINNHKGVDLKKYFIGIPAPMFGILCFLPVAWFEITENYICPSAYYLEQCIYSLTQVYDDQSFKIAIGSYYIALCLFAVSRFPILALKNIKILKNKFCMIAIVCLGVFAVKYSDIACLVVSIGFVAFALFGFVKIKLKKCN